ncbi:pilus assembly protein [Dyella caseinilytica]|uniref:PilY1 beta-propeller domain-containing protein n=1 Tax=Dyella caseinilytica TaxID=1849581 RepID=A0ABX7GQP9_9GAMM|nr:PilC/PilY family type IV pilus protein [Dyella caseinilytica]QRN52751.1 hypothetical protein ISN74_15025 [Dyella caseinilytica]GGA08469.1 type IV fimbrial biogenesis PilY1 [Dyella caseinilytica]
MSRLLRALHRLHLDRAWLACAIVSLVIGQAHAAQTSLSDTPVYSTSNVPANLMLALSVEYPTGTVGAYTNATGYSSSSTYLGYFDPAKCYSYNNNTGAGYFVPANTSGPVCNGYWSGNMLNWALMTSLDEFRQALTGGNRLLDGPSTAVPAPITVLERSNLNAAQSTTSNFPNKQIGSSVNVSPSTVIGDSNYSSQPNVYLESAGQGTTFVISNNSAFSNSGWTNSVPNVATTYNAEVQVCVSSMLESNCQAYGGNYKPEGLIQQNFTRVRVGVAAYTFSFGNLGANGAVRALLRDNGPTTYNGYGTRLNNAYAEWSSQTGVFSTNPDAADSIYGSAPGGVAFTNSGAINYLNQFGYQGNYEHFDTVSDLYWATLAYYMQVPLDASYTSGLTQSNSTDPSFPVFTGMPAKSSNHPTVNDPIQYSCQNNAIVVIGDSHTWYDTRVPTTAPASTNGSVSTPLTPLIASGNVATALNASTYVTTLGNLPLIEAQGTTAASKTMAQYLNTTALGSTLEVSDTGTATYNLAGLAYYAHINDIRADISGNQKITTYIVDVLEPGTYDGSSSRPTYNPSALGSGAGPNEYWLAAKYGGFDDINNNGIPANILTWHTNTTTAAAQNLRPDNYLPGNQANLIQSGLQQIFNNLTSSAAQTGSGLTVSSTRSLSTLATNTAPYYSSVSGFPAYSTLYTPVAWTGDVMGMISTTAVGGTVTAVSNSTPWHAQLQLDTLTQSTSASGSTIVGWNTGRRIVTWNGSTGVPFRYSSLSASEQSAVNTSGNGAALVNYLRGDKSNEGTLFRVRTHVLGDIVDSSTVLVQGALSPSYSETANPGYTAFSAGVANREPVVYVGGNDGMLHAFEADFQTPTTANPVTGGGSELFAYVPSLLYNGPNSTPLIDGLPALANLGGVSANIFTHHFYVDATPQVADVDFTLTGNGQTTPSTSAGTANWHTILVGGLGKGGKGIYALDVTSVPQVVDTTSSAAVESTQAGKVLWEFTDPDMGYSFGAPLIVKTRKYGWVVIMTSGYGNTSGSDALQGHGILYVLNAQTGALLEKIDTGAGTIANPAGLAQAAAYTQNVTDGTIDQVYAGDLLGNVWRFDLTESAGTGSYPAPTLFATLTDPSGNPQPITTAPRIEESLSSNNLSTLRWVFVGTGQFLNITDLTNTQQQTMYALRDGSGSTPSTTGLPLVRKDLVANTDLSTGVTLSDTALGWYYDLTNSAGSNGGTERIVVNPAATSGLDIVAWVTVIPSSNPCALQGAVYATTFDGESVLLSNGTAAPYLTLPAAPTGVQLLEGTTSSGTKAVTVATSNSSGTTTFQGVSTTPPTNQINRVNWREILN